MKHNLIDAFLSRLIALAFFWRPLKSGQVHHQNKQEGMWLVPITFNGGSKFSLPYRDYLLLTPKELADSRDRASRYAETAPASFPNCIVERALWPLS